MSADGPASPAPTQPPPPPAAPHHDGKASGGMRLLAALGALILLFGAAVMFVIVSNPDNLPLCKDLLARAGAGECFDITDTQYTISRVLAAPAGALAALAGLLGFYVAATGRRGDLMLKLAAGAVVLGGLAVVVSQVF